MIERKPVMLGVVFFLFLLLLSACREDISNTPSAMPSAISTVTPTETLTQPSTAVATILPTIQPDNNSVKQLFSAYEGSWVDQEYNYRLCMFCVSHMDIGFPESTDNPTESDSLFVFLTFYDGLKMERAVDASSQVKLNKAGVGEFEIHEEMSGFAGKGEIRLQQDQIVVHLTLSGGPEKAQELFKTQRTYIRDPYESVILQDPIELAKRNCGNCNKYIMKLELGVEWHEDILSGKYLEVVNAWDENAQLVRRFIVNTIKGTVMEIPLITEPRNTFWDSKAEMTALLHNPEYIDTQEVITLENLKAGLKFANPQIRWYCTYKIIDVLNEGNRKELVKLIAPLMEDADEDVQKAAKFTNALLTRTYDSDKFLKAKNAEKIIFYKYQEATYNNGQIWMIEKDKVKHLYKTAGSINHLSLSKDGKWLVVENGGRIWSSMVLIDMQSDKPLELNKLIHEILINPLYNYTSDEIKNVGPYCYFSLKEWSPDSKKFLFSYELNDMNSNDFYGFAIYNIKTGKVEQVIKSNDSNNAQLPEDFKW